MMDLFGVDLFVVSGVVGEFVWLDGVFLVVLKVGDWVLFDELNFVS